MTYGEAKVFFTYTCISFCYLLAVCYIAEHWDFGCHDIRSLDRSRTKVIATPMYLQLLVVKQQMKRRQ